MNKTKKIIKPAALTAKKQARRKRKDNLPEILPPSVDVVFKRLFGDERNKDILAAFLTEILGVKVTPADITIIDPHLRINHVRDKLGILDVKLRLRGGKIVTVEMQVGKLKDIHKRLEYYISRTVSGQLKKSDEYAKLVPVIMIFITKGPLRMETEKYHCEFGTLEKTEHFEFHGLRTIHTFDLSKLPKKRGESGLVDWMKFINATKKEEFMTLAQERKQLARALDALEETSMNARTRALYQARVDAYRDEMAKLDYALDEGFNKGMRNGLRKGMAKGMAKGMEKGMTQGMERGVETVAKTMKAKGMPAKTIAELTGLPIDKIKRLSSKTLSAAT